VSRSRKHRPKADGSPPSGDSASGEPRGFFARRPILRFVLLFGLLWGLYELLFFAFVLESRPFNSYLGLNADLAGAIVRAMGHEVNVSGQHMSGPGFGLVPFCCLR
jgi:hypothetical protein